MAEEGPSKADINAVFKKLRSYAANKICFDCGAKNPTWASVTYGVFICIDCSAIHRGLGVHVSFVRSTQLDTNWTWLQLRAMQCGGNISATQFFRQHGCTTPDAQQKYRSRAGQLYREKLHHAAVAAMRLHGTKLHIDSHDQLSPLGQGPEAEDFFDEHSKENIPRNASEISMSEDMCVADSNISSGEGPSVEGLDEKDLSPRNPEQKKAGTAIGKKPKGKGGARKGGLGAQKVSATFSEIEQRAEVLDKEREEAAKARFAESTKANEPDPEVTKLSSRLMVQDINKQRQKEEERLKHADPSKVEQFERLGMGFGGGKGGVTHSIASDIKTIQQEGVRQKRESRRKEPDFEDDWEILSREPINRRSGFDDYSNGNAMRGGNDDDDFFKTFDVASKPSQPDLPSYESGNSPRDRNKTSLQAASSEDAQKKFGNAKAISSDQYFGDRGPDFETRSNLSRFEGASAIGSSDLFGGGSTGGAGSGTSYVSHVPDMSDIKDSVKQGVSKVGSKLSTLTSSVQSYISRTPHTSAQHN